MKLYVIPTETRCNASCGFCITRFRNLKGKEFLELDDLEKILESLDLTKIEITGGGEPLLNRDIKDIINSCHKKAFTQLYTNGGLVERTDLGNLDVLCISRAHYDCSRNNEIMGIDYDLEAIKQKGIPIKFSLLLHGSGINTAEDVERYLAWAKQEGAFKVVVRQMMPYDYAGELSGEFVGAEKVFRDLGIKDFQRVEEGANFDYEGMAASIKYSPCDCNEQLFLHANGSLGKIE